MALQKESITINFAQGLETFSDPNQLPIGKFVSLQNCSYIKNASGEYAALKKRNGYGPLSQTVATATFITTYNNSLVAIGPGSVQGYSTIASTWINKGLYQPVSLTVNQLVRNSYNQTNQDATISQAGVVITAFQSDNPNGKCQYAIFDSAGQNLVPPTNLPLNGNSQVIGQPQTYSIGSSFIIAYGTTSTGQTQLTVTQIQNISPFSVLSTSNVDSGLFSTQNLTPPYLGNTTGGIVKPIFDGVASGGNVYLSWVSSPNGVLTSGKITPAFTISSTIVVASVSNAACISIAVDQANSIIYTTTASSYAFNYAGTNLSFNQIFTSSASVASSSYYMTTIGGNTTAYAPGVTNIASYANGYLLSIYEARSIFSMPAGTIPPSTTSLVSRQITSAGVAGAEAVLSYQMGIGSKPAFVSNDVYFTGTYGSPTNLQNAYFILGSSGQAVSKFAYEGGGGYYYTGLPSMAVVGSSAFVSYLSQDLLVSVANATTNGSSGQVSAAAAANIYTQTGVNYGNFAFGPQSLSTKDTGNALSIPGGFLSNYSGIQCVENNFHLFPEVLQFNINLPGGVTGANECISPQNYQYCAIFQWTDEQANIHRSSTSLIATMPSFAGSGSVSYFIDFNILPITNKSNYTVSLFRWSPLQQTFYKVGSANFTPPFSQTQTTGSISAGSFCRYRLFGSIIQFIDFSSDAQIIGNEILYTNGNVLEDYGVQACQASAVWDARFWTILSENGLIAYSKIIIPATPIEMSQLQTIFVPSSQTAQGPSGPPTCIFPMDDKLIIFRKNSILYINGSGPDSTGANSQYSDPIQIPSGVGCANQASIVLTPPGLMFQSDNGIWLLGRDLVTKFVGKDVEAFNNQTVLSVTCVPGTTEVRFELSGGAKLVYDYFIDQWDSDSILSGQSSIVYNNLHTFINQVSQVYQETNGTYLDGSTATVMSFKTGWISLSGVQGYQRAYWMDILAQYQSGHTYTMGIAYDYNPAIVQTATIIPTNTTGSGSFVEQWQIAFKQPQCQSFQLTFNEISSGSAGAGLTISTLNIVYGRKKTYPRNISAKNRTG